MPKEIINRDTTREAIQKHQEKADWEYKDEAAFWYGISQEMDRRFFNGLVYPDGSKVPAPFIAFEDLQDQRTLACYHLFPDEYGIIGKITFNTAWYEDRNGRKEWKLGKYSQGETMLHEYMHLYQQIGRGKDPYDQKKHGKNTHNKEFVELCGRLGIHPAPVTGIHTKIATKDSPIDILLREMGISRPKGADKVPENNKRSWADWLVFKDKKPKGKSTLHKWGCKCGQHARIGTKDFYAKCEKPGGCGEVFVLLDGKPHNIYKG